MNLPMTQQNSEGYDMLKQEQSELNQTDSTSEAEIEQTLIAARDLRLYYGSTEALKGVDLDIAEQKVTAFIGPSGCGKSTLLRCFNRMNDLIDIARVTGSIELQGTEIHAPTVNVTELRRRVGMVFQKSNPFPKSIFENVAFGLRIQGEKRKSALEPIVEKSLKAVALWDEVSDRLNDSALALSGGQQQRLCIARAIATEPEVLLMDEPCSALDPIATAKVEELIHSLKKLYTIVIVTHNMQQATRVSDYTAFMLQGELVEFGKTEQLFQKPTHKKTDDYIRGKFG